jgi:hypothetical protein
MGFSMRYRSKTLAAWLALLFGGVGAHWFYLVGARRLRPWVYLVLFPLSCVVGCAEAIRFGLMPDARWHARYNPGQEDLPGAGGLAVTAAVLGLGLGATSAIALLAILIQWLLTGAVA